ncbi:MAG: hypothetical protein WBD20_13175 [Pirellulaceae bacterium]
MSRRRFRISLRVILLVVLPLSAASMATWTRYRNAKLRVEQLEWDAYQYEARFRTIQNDDTASMIWREFWGANVMEDVITVTLSDEYNDESDFLKRVPNVRSVTLFDTDHVLKHPFSMLRHYCPAVNKLGVYSWTGSEFEYESLAGIGNLKSLVLHEVGLSDAQFLRMISKSPGLKSLRLADTSMLTDKAFATIDSLTQLEYLEVENVAIGDAEMTKIGALTELRELNLAGTQITDRGIANLIRNSDGATRLGKLEQLNLDRCQLRGDHFDALGSLEALSWLSLDDVPFDTRQWSKLVTCKHLLDLSVRRTQIDDQVTAAIAMLPSLLSIDLSLCDLRPGSIALLRRSQSLQEVNLSGTQITDDSLMHFADMSSLAKLDLSDTCTSEATVAKLHAEISARKPQFRAASSGDVWVHDAKTGVKQFLLPIWPLFISESGVGVQYHSDSSFGILGGTTLSLLQATANRQWLKIRGLNVSPQAISSDASRLLIEDFPGIKILDANTHSVLFQRDSVDENNFAFAGNDIAIGSNKMGTGTVWNTRTGVETKFKTGNRTTELTLSPDGKTLATYDAWNLTLAILSRPDLVPVKKVNHNIRRYKDVKSHAFATDGSVVVCRTIGDSYRVSDSQNQVIATIPSELSNAILSPHADRLLTWQEDSFPLRMYDIANGKLIWEFVNHAPVERVRFTPDGTQLIVESDSVRQ